MCVVTGKTRTRIVVFRITVKGDDDFVARIQIFIIVIFQLARHNAVTCKHDGAIINRSIRRKSDGFESRLFRESHLLPAIFGNVHAETIAAVRHFHAGYEREFLQIIALRFAARRRIKRRFEFVIGEHIGNISSRVGCARFARSSAFEFVRREIFDVRPQIFLVRAGLLRLRFLRRNAESKRY